MAKISARTAASSVAGTDLLPLVQGSNDRKVTVEDFFKLYLGGGTNGLWYSGHFADLDAAIAYIGASNGTLIIHDPITATGNCTVPSTLSVMFTGGGMLTVSNATTTTFNGSFTAPMEKIFILSGTGVVKFGVTAISDMYVEWWGAVADSNGNGSTGTDNTLPIQQCFDCALDKAFDDTNPAAYSRPTVIMSNGRYRTTAVSLGYGVNLTMTGGVLIAGTGLGGFSFATPLLTINAAAFAVYKDLSVAEIWFGSSGHKFNPAYAETNIGIKFDAAQQITASFGVVYGFHIGVQVYGNSASFATYSEFVGGLFSTVKIGIDIRTDASPGFSNEMCFRMHNFSPTSNINVKGQICGVRFSSDDDGQHGQNNNRFHDLTFQPTGTSNAWTSAAAKNQYDYYSTSSKFWIYMSADSTNGTIAPPPTNAVTFANATEIMTFTPDGGGRSFSPQNDMVIHIANTDGTGVAPTGLTLYTWYWVINASANTCQLSTSKGGSAVTFSTDGSGNMHVEAQKGMQYTDDAGKLWQCEGELFRTCFFVDDTSCGAVQCTGARWEGGVGPFVHYQLSRRFANLSSAANLWEVYVIGGGANPGTGTNYYTNLGDLNPAASSIITGFPLYNVIKDYYHSNRQVVRLEGFQHRYIKSVTLHSTIMGMAFVDADAWDTITQSHNVGGNNCILCKDYVSINYTGNWHPVVFVDVLTHKKFYVQGDLFANSQFCIGKAYDANFKALPLDNYNKTLCGGSPSRHITTQGGYLDMVSSSNHVAYGVPNVTISGVNATRYVAIGMHLGVAAAQVRGLTLSTFDDGLNDVPLTVVTPFGMAVDDQRYSYNEPIVGWFKREGEFIENILTIPTAPQGWLVKAGGAMAPALANGVAIIAGELRVNDSGKVYAAQAAHTSGGSAVTNVTGTGVNINDGAGNLWDYQCNEAVLEVVSRSTRDVTTMNVSGPATLAVDKITGSQNVILLSSNASPGTQTTRTAAEMVVDHGGGRSGSWNFRIINTGAGTFTLGAGAGVTLSGTMTVLQNTFRDFVATITSATAITITTTGTGTYS